MQSTCGKFDWTLPMEQHLQLRSMWENTMGKVVGPLVGMSSDGDARRRKFQQGELERKPK
jgi:hypothetical protein